MRILLLSDINSSHTRKWALGLASAGFEIGIFSLSDSDSDWYSQKGITVFDAQSFSKNTFISSEIFKLKYLNSLKYLKEVLKEFKPDVVHAHYATSYGLLGRLSKFHPYFVSVWGSDVLDFPQKSFLHKKVVKKNLMSADRIFTTSETLNREVFALTNKRATTIPFGIETDIFKPAGGKKLFEVDAIVVGTIKTLQKHYCIDVLIKSFAKIFSKHPAVKLRLLIVGAGEEQSALKSLADDLGLSKVVLFAGKIPYEHIQEYHNSIDVFANLSSYESFGVSVLEASACGKPVVATDTGGLKEVVKNNVTGILVPVKDVDATATAIENLILNKQLRQEMGEAGRKFVIENYDWQKNLQQMIDVYNRVQ